MGTKGNVVLYLDKEIVEKSKELGLNLSKTFENHLKRLIQQYSTFNQVNNFNSSKNNLLVGLPGFEPGSIEPKPIKWSSFRQYLFSKYSRGYALQIIEHSRKYYPMLTNVNEIQLAKPTVRNNIVNALVVLSRYLGAYDRFKREIKSHGIKKHKADPIEAFTRIFNSNAHSGLGKWYHEALAVLDENEKLYLRFMVLSGTRAMEGIKSFNILASLGAKYTEEYYNTQTNFLEHFRYPKQFLRNSKNLYVSAVPKELLDQISQSSKVSYNVITKKVHRAGLPMKVKKLRSYYATTMRQQGLLSEQIDLMQGRVGKSIFLAHYFKQDPEALSDKILALLPSLEKTLIL